MFSYIRTIADKSQCKDEYQRGWQDVFETEDRSVAERVAMQTGHEKVEWLSDGSVKVTSRPLDGIRIDPRTEEPTWFNSIVLLHYASYGGRKETYQTMWETVYGKLYVFFNSNQTHYSVPFLLFCATLLET